MNFPALLSLLAFGLAVWSLVAGRSARQKGDAARSELAGALGRVEVTLDRSRQLLLEHALRPLVWLYDDQGADLERRRYYALLAVQGVGDAVLALYAGRGVHDDLAVMALGDLVETSRDASPPKVIPTRPTVPRWLATPEDVMGVAPLPSRAVTAEDIAEASRRAWEGPVAEAARDVWGPETLDPDQAARARQLHEEAERIELERALPRTLCTECGEVYDGPHRSWCPRS